MMGEQVSAFRVVVVYDDYEPKKKVIRSPCVLKNKGLFYCLKYL